MALLGMGTALAVPPAASAQELDVAALQAEVDAVAKAVEAGGVAAPPSPELPPVEVEVPVEPDVMPVIEPEEPSETAAEPAPEAPSAPTNVNVDIRILSPGDNGDVTQVIRDVTQIVPDAAPTAPRGEAAPRGDPLPGPQEDFTWNWEWTTGSGCDMRAADVTWNWKWDSGCASGGPPDPDFLPDELMPRELRDELISAERELTESVGSLPGGESIAERGLMLDWGSGGEPAKPRPAAHPRTVPGPRPIEHWQPPPPVHRGGTVPSFEATAPPRAAGGGATERQSARDESPAPAPAAAPSGAASAAGGGGGSSAPVAAALLALLCLMAPRALGRALPRVRTLSSLLSSSRLERPG